MEKFDSLIELITCLAKDENKMDRLLEIKILLTNIPPSTITKASQFNIQPIFQCFETIEIQQIELTCEVLKKILGHVDTKILITNFFTELISGLTHSSTLVEELCLTQILRITKKEVNLILNYPQIINATIQLLATDYIALVNLSSQILSSIASSYEGLKYLITDIQIQSLLFEISNKSDVIRYRINDIIVEIICANKESIQLLKENDSPLIPGIFIDLNSLDPLLQLNCVELLARLSTHRHALNWLEELQLTTAMESLLLKSENDSMAFIIMPGLIQFFGQLCYIHPTEIEDRFRNFMLMILSNISELHQVLLSVSLQTISLLASLPKIKLILQHSFDIEMKSCCNILAKISKNSLTEMRVMAMQTIKQLFYLQCEDQTQELQQITELWFNHLGGTQFLTSLIQISKQPFVELKCGALSIIECLAVLPWAQVQLRQSPGFVEYLLDRSCEHVKEGLVGKYAIVQKLVASPSVTSVFGESTCARLMEYVRQGEFYARAETLMVMEDAG